jgi:hypothetical protein
VTVRFVRVSEIDRGAVLLSCVGNFSAMPALSTACEAGSAGHRKFNISFRCKDSENGVPLSFILER